MECIKKTFKKFNIYQSNNRIVPVDNLYDNFTIYQENFDDDEFSQILEDISNQVILNTEKKNINCENKTKNKRKRNTKCPICLERVTKETSNKIICKNKKCKTYYHKECINEWVKNKPAGELKCLICTLPTIGKAQGNRRNNINYSNYRNNSINNYSNYRFQYNRSVL